MTPAMLALEDGFALSGRVLGAQGETFGEVVFNTSMTGYQEILTDPSYKGQIVVMTYPLIGNYGINREDVESLKPWVEGFVIRERSAIPSNWRAQARLDEYLTQHGIVAIDGLDTRSLTKHLREAGSKQGVVSTVDLDPKRLAKRALDSPHIVGRDLVREVTCATPYEWTEGVSAALEAQPDQRVEGKRVKRVVVIDCGVKQNILRMLVACGFRVTVVPATTTLAQIEALQPDGVVISNGPGDPEGVPYVVQTARGLLGKRPILGICLGHQILGLAMGGKTFKLKFGHHGANHPVMDVATRKVSITSQNHNFAVDVESIPGGEVEVSHLNLNDKTVEGLRHTRWPILSIQYHPEASPGPHDAREVFKRFVEML